MKGATTAEPVLYRTALDNATWQESVREYTVDMVIGIRSNNTTRRAAGITTICGPVRHLFFCEFK